MHASFISISIYLWRNNDRIMPTASHLNRRHNRKMCPVFASVSVSQDYFKLILVLGKFKCMTSTSCVLQPSHRWRRSKQHKSKNVGIKSAYCFCHEIPFCLSNILMLILFTLRIERQRAQQQKIMTIKCESWAQQRRKEKKAHARFIGYVPNRHKNKYKLAINTQVKWATVHLVVCFFSNILLLFAIVWVNKLTIWNVAKPKVSLFNEITHNSTDCGWKVPANCLFSSGFNWTYALCIAIFCFFLFSSTKLKTVDARFCVELRIESDAMKMMDECVWLHKATRKASNKRNNNNNKSSNHRQFINVTWYKSVCVLTAEIWACRSVQLKKAAGCTCNFKTVFNIVCLTFYGNEPIKSIANR